MASKDPQKEIAALFAAALEDEESKTSKKRPPPASGAARPATTSKAPATSAKPPPSGPSSPARPSASAPSTGARIPAVPSPSRSTASPPADPQRPITGLRALPAQPKAASTADLPPRKTAQTSSAVPTVPSRSSFDTRGDFSARTPEPVRSSGDLPRSTADLPRSTGDLPRSGDGTSSRIKVPASLPPSSLPPGATPKPRGNTVRLDKSTASKRPMNAAEIRGKPASELGTLDPDASEQLDHKGRSKPIYARRTQRPQTYRPSPVIDFLLGLYPGARLMAREKLVSGLGYAVIALFMILPAAIVAGSWSGRLTTIESLTIDRAWLLAHAAVIVIALFAFELLRFFSSMDKIQGRLRTSRGLAAVLAPALLIAIGAPSIVAASPSVIEPVWLIGVFLTIAGAFAAIDCLPAEEGEESGGARRMVIAGIALAVALIAGIFTLVLSPEISSTLERGAADAGFQIIPQVIRALRISV